MSRLSGKEALSAIDTALDRARRGLSDVERQYAHARSALAKIRQEEVGVYAKLAKLRLLEIEGGELIDALSDVDRTVSEILEERGTAARRLEESIDTANARLGESERQRTVQQEAVAAASDALDSAEAAAQKQLSADAAYQNQLAATEQADFVADQAEDKAASARRDRIEKGRPFESDPLFSYLFSRGYGTSKYQAWPLVRWLDGRVAGLCGYEAARRDYSLLIEIPERLNEHAARMRAEFERQVEALRELEAAAAGAAGVPILSERLQEEEARLSTADAEVAAQEDALRDLVRERVLFANGSDSWYLRCIELLSNAMRRQGIGLLQEKAARTREPEDDELVHRLMALAQEAERVEGDLEDFQRVYERESARLDNVEDLRRRFKSDRFDDPRSEFLDAALFTLVLERLLNGAVSSNDAWKAMARQQRMRAMHADPRFGTRRFPKAPRGGPWRWPPGGGFGGGGFGSGGGFGGGGFKTGGGF